MTKYKLGQRVTTKHSHTLCKTGYIVAIETVYVVSQDDDFTFKYRPDELQAQLGQEGGDAHDVS